MAYPPLIPCPHTRQGRVPLLRDGPMVMRAAASHAIRAKWWPRCGGLCAPVATQQTQRDVSEKRARMYVCMLFAYQTAGTARGQLQCRCWQRRRRWRCSCFIEIPIQAQNKKVVALERPNDTMEHINKQARDARVSENLRPGMCGP